MAIDSIAEEGGRKKKDDVRHAGEEVAGAESNGRKRKRKRSRKTHKKAEDDEEEGWVSEEDGTTGRAGEEEEGYDNAPSSTPESGRPDGSAAAAGTVYVEGISYEATEDDLVRFFQDKGCGKVKEVRLPRWQDSGRPRGYAHIEFKKTDEGVAKALSLSGARMMGRYLTVQRAQAPKSLGVGGSLPLKDKPPGASTGQGRRGKRAVGGYRNGLRRDMDMGMHRVDDSTDHRARVQRISTI